MTRLTKRYRPLLVLAGGTLLYAIGVGSVALGTGFWGFWTSMVILTFGEPDPLANGHSVCRQPGASGYARSVYEPVQPDLGCGFGDCARGRGFLNDNFGPVTIWYGGFVVG